MEISIFRSRITEKKSSNSMKLLLLPILITLLCCSPASVQEKSSITIMSFNVQNLFDHRVNGGEYEEYDPQKSSWNEDSYHLRLRRLAQVITQGSSRAPDIVLLQEIEHIGVLEDLWRMYLAREGYTYYLATESSGSTEVGVVSRFSPQEVSVHHITGFPFHTRPIMEMHYTFGGETLVLFNNHWKSKIPSPQESEPVRIALADMLMRRIEELGITNYAIVAGGDFNESYKENIEVRGDYPTAISFGSGGSIELAPLPESVGNHRAKTPLYTPWPLEPSGMGSFWYGGEWEYIDQFMVNSVLFDGEGVEYRKFSVLKPPFLLTQKGYPYRWNVATLRGYSDHLPLLLELDVLKK